MSTLFLGKNPFRWLVQTTRKKGFSRVLKIAWHAIMDSIWDLVHGTETLTRIHPHALDTNSSNKQHATYYGATRARPLMQLFTHLALSRKGGFVDLGSGKGRVLMVAAQYGFEKIVGIDFSESLCRLAHQNLKAFRRRRKVESKIIILHTDAVHYRIQGDEHTFFLYDPFGREVLSKVLQNIRASLVSHPRQLCLIYNSPRHHELVEQSGVFAHHRHFEIGGNEFCVYGNAPISGRV